MRRWSAWLGLAMFVFAGVNRPAAAPLEAYGRLPTIEDIDITPNGKLLAFVTELSGQRMIVIYDIDAASPSWGLRVGEQKIRQLHWADNDRLLITASTTSSIFGVIAPKQEYFVTQSVSLATKSGHPILQDATDSLNVSLGVPESRTIGGHTVVFVQGMHFVNNLGFLTLFSVDLDSNRARAVAVGNKYAAGWWVDERGNIIAAASYDNDSRTWSIKLSHDGMWQEVYSQVSPVDPPEILGITSDGASLVLQTIDDKGFSPVWINLSDGTRQPPPATNSTFGVPLEDPATHRIIGGVAELGHTKYKFFNAADQLAWNSVLDAFPDENVRLVAWSADRKRIIVLVDGTRNGSEYMAVDLNSNRATDLGPAYRGIAVSDVAPVTFIHYAAADGTTIPAYLTLPNGHAAENLPLIVFPHGGPLAEDEPGFDWWAQAMASRGYAVLQPEFRGSDGYGYPHTVAGFGQFGRKMQTDLSDGVRFLASEHIVDPKRVCIVGGSYGGYAALAGPTLDRGVYRCAVSVGGISDPRTFLRWIEHREAKSDSLPIRFWTRFMGVENGDDPKLSEISPLSHADNADAPILLIHGTDDTVVPIEQSEDMSDALKAAGKPVTFVKLKSEDHWLSRTETRQQMLSATVDFLERNNPPN